MGTILLSSISIKFLLGYLREEGWAMNFNAQHAKLLAVILAVLLTACTSIPADIEIQAVSVGKSEPILNDVINGYQQWTRVNPDPVLMDPRVALMCAMPMPVKTRVMEKQNPHQANYITVYVNDLGMKAMMSEKKPHFPKGSVIVKEKLSMRNSSSPELLTVMIKREAGYNSANGDWEYMVVDGAGKDVQARGQMENCQACHTMVKSTDYVYRSYLPPDVSQKLK